MQLSSLLGFATTAAVAATAASPAANVYIFDPAVPPGDSPRLSREVARLILSHRLRDAPDERGPAVPETVSSADLDASINAYGKPRQSLFTADRQARAPQLVILIEGVADKSVEHFGTASGGITPAFTILEPPSAEANHDLVTSDFVDYTGAWIGPDSCPLELALNPHDDRCWNSDSLVVKYDAMKDPDIFSNLYNSIPAIATSELETTIIVLPESSRVGPVDRWAPHPSKLSRRQKETVMELENPAPTTTVQATPTGSDSPDSTGPPGVIFTPDPVTGAEQFADGVCYTSRSKCMTDTFGCFRHGTCKEQTEGCFKCVCGTTKDKFGVETQWTGNMCQKADVSMEFWMFLGVGILTFFALGGGLIMLVGVGMEDLPGVLGAGVVKSK